MLVIHDDESIYIAYSDPEFSLSGITDQKTMVYVSYIPKNLDGIPVADFSLSNDNGKITQTGKCIGDTIKTRSQHLQS